MEKSEEKIEKTTSIRGFEEEYSPYPETSGIDKEVFTSEPGVNIDTLYNVVKISPELVGCIQAITEDTVADKWRFEGSKSAIKKAETFQAKSKFYKVLANAIVDLLISGNGYILKLSVDEDKVKSLLRSLTVELTKALSVDVKKEIDYEVLLQDLKTPNDLQLLKSSTIRINFDETGKIASYIQQVRGKRRVYKPSDIIHLSSINIGGQPYGFTPVESLLSDLGTLIFAKEFAGKYFENDGMPYFWINLPEENPDSRNYQLLKQEIKELKKSKNKYRVLLTTGKVESQQINKFNKDMEFAKLIQHFTQIILIAMGVPAHRINLTIDVRQIGGAVNRAYEGYYKRIAFLQNILSDSLNAELWNYFNVRMNFNQVYKIDEMREAQIAQIAAQVGFMTIEEIRERIGLKPELPKGKMGLSEESNIDFEGDKKREQGREPENNKTDNKLKEFSDEMAVRLIGVPQPQKKKEESEGESPIEISTEKLFEEMKQKIKSEILQEVRPREESPRESIIDNKTKFINDAVEISWRMFRMIVEGKVGKDKFDLAKILYMETSDLLILFFADEQWKYKCTISKKETDIEKFKIENLRYAIRIFN
jgi:HK97 family phage portal protein